MGIRRSVIVDAPSKNDILRFSNLKLCSFIEVGEIGFEEGGVKRNRCPAPTLSSPR